jgi:hypothetical protein
MRKTILFLAVLLIPLGLLIYAYLYGTTVVVVKNTGAAGAEVWLMTVSGNSYELSDRRTAKAGDFTYLLYSPKLEGAAEMRCLSGTTLKRFELGKVSPDHFVFHYLKIDGCTALKEHTAKTI